MRESRKKPKKKNKMLKKDAHKQGTDCLESVPCLYAEIFLKILSHPVKICYSYNRNLFGKEVRRNWKRNVL